MSQLKLDKSEPEFIVIGGTYREICVWPHWDQLFGSGLRGSAVWAAFNEPNKIGFITWCDSVEKKELELIAQTYGISLKPYIRKDSIEFQYEYPLARPFQYSGNSFSEEYSDIEVKINSGLLYGILERNPRVIANKLVWDPQAGSKTQSFRYFQHKVNSLAIILNRLEAICMLEKPQNVKIETKQLSIELLKLTKAEVVVVKDGPYGAWISTKDATKWIPCFKTNEIFSIGSGDVFSSIFAYAWLQKKLFPEDAALLASKGTAHYCFTRDVNIPIDESLMINEGFTKEKPELQKSIYLAGPIFNVPERWFVREVAEHFRSMGFSVFSPFEDVGYHSNSKIIADADLEGLKKSDAIFVIADGLDAGTLFESGFSIALNKPVFIYSEKESESDLTMLIGSNAKLYRDLTSAVYWTAWELN